MRNLSDANATGTRTCGSSIIYVSSYVPSKYKIESTMNRIEKLQHLINILENVPSDDSFDMDVWYLYGLNTSCGFSACALGWAAMDPVFQDMGLGGIESGITFTDNDDTNYCGYDAGCKFFDLEPSESSFLFCYNFYDTHGYVSTKEVIEHVKILISKYERRRK
jgi:hypothetical protein